VLRENLVRFEQLPLVTRVAALPALAPGARVALDIGAIDLLERSVACTYRETLGEAGVTQDAAEPGAGA
jgi:exoribonuclease-2